MSRRNEEGQVFLLAALMLMVIVGIAAFCVNASYFYYQHQRMQAQVDEQTRLAAGTGCNVSSGSFDGGTLAITPVVPGGFFGQDGSYCDGVYTKNPGGLFGNILRFPNKISVHAIAEHGGSTEPYFSMLGLDKDAVCSIQFQGDESITITGEAYSNGSTPALSCIQKLDKTTFTSPYTLTNAIPTLVDPFKVSVPTSGLAPITNTTSSAITVCGYPVPNGAKYYQPQSSSGIAVTSGSTLSSSNKAVYLPYCSGGVTKPGIYLITGNLSTSASSEVDSYDSVFILMNGATVGGNGGTWKWNSPDVGAFGGYALYQQTPCSSIGTTQFNGGVTITINGLVDLSCTNLIINGGADHTISGSIVAYTMYFSGSSGGVTVIKEPPVPPTRGAFLVQ